MYYKNETDETLVMLTLAGEQTAYEVLVTRYQKAVISSAITVTKNHFMAEDAAQDAFVTAWMKLNTLQDPKKYASWVCRIARNCALNMINRYRSFLPLDVVDNIDIIGNGSDNPAMLYALSEERNEVDTSIEKLPEKVRKIIHLHYFEDLSIAEIADRMRISEGTVKWQLHDGRKRIRKELCAMDEKYTDTLVQRVMKKVEELKLWQLKNNKSGFEKVYKEVLREVEELPECREKQHALADVLMRGWWWLPGDKNDALFARIKEAAIQGNNDEVMEFIVAREDSKVYGGGRIDFIRDKQIPSLEKTGLVRTLAREWFWLGYEYFRNDQIDLGYEAFDKVQALLTPADIYYALVTYARDVERKMELGYKDKNKKRYLNNATADELHWINGSLRYWKQQQYGEGYMNSIDRQIPILFHNNSRCDGWLYDEEMTVGEIKTATDGTTLTFASDCETVSTPCGVFDNCQLWVTELFAKYSGHCINKVWYKSGVGIVKYERTVDELTDVRLLKSYNVTECDSLLPLASGNTWEYADTYDHNIIVSELIITVSYADSEKVVLSTKDFAERYRYDENSWLDMIQQIRNEYWIYENDQGKTGDITIPLAKVEALATTPMEKAHAKVAVSVAKRIVEGESLESDYTGHWNFFSKNLVYSQNGILKITYDYRWSFELKSISGTWGADTPLLYNDIYGILQDAANCIWSDEWHTGMTPTVEYDYNDKSIRTSINCEDGGCITTKAGTFENCLKLSMDIHGMKDGWEYRGGKKVYYFALGIGIVRTENEYCDGSRTAVYELTSYEGTGDGYMPMSDGLVRRYDALDLTDGYVGGVEYTYVQNNKGQTVIFKDAVGIRKTMSPITQYSAVQCEVKENQIYNSGNWQEGQMLYGVNNFRLILHMIARPSHNIYTAKRSIEIHGFNMKLIELLGEDNTVPPAWYTLYAWSALIRSAAYFGNGEKENGYSHLEIAAEYYEKANSFEDGELLDVGNSDVTGEVKYVCNSGKVLLSNGNYEPIDYGHSLKKTPYVLYNALSMNSGWEWFNSVRNEERFKEYIKRAKDIYDKRI